MVVPRQVFRKIAELNFVFKSEMNQVNMGRETRYHPPGPELYPCCMLFINVLKECFYSLDSTFSLSQSFFILFIFPATGFTHISGRWLL